MGASILQFSPVAQCHAGLLLLPHPISLHKIGYLMHREQSTRQLGKCSRILVVPPQVYSW